MVAMKKFVSTQMGLDGADIFPSFKILHGLTGATARLVKLRQMFDSVFDYVIDKKRESLYKTTKNNDYGDTEDCGDDLLGVLLRLQESGSFKLPITSTNVKAILMDLLTAGTDTSSGTVEWAMSELIRNPRAMKKVQDEVRQSVKGKKRVQQMIFKK